MGRASVDLDPLLLIYVSGHPLLDESSMEMMKGAHSSTLSSPVLPSSSLQVVGGAKNEGSTALELLSIEQDLDHIVSFSAGIDGMLGGGVPVGKITEFCGSPGIGKTQLRWVLRNLYCLDKVDIYM